MRPVAPFVAWLGQRQATHIRVADVQPLKQVREVIVVPIRWCNGDDACAGRRVDGGGEVAAQVGHDDIAVAEGLHLVQEWRGPGIEHGGAVCAQHGL